VLAIAAVAGLHAQMKRSHQLRALAIVELYGATAADAKTRPTGGRVIPVAILVGDKWYDAGTYGATPRPLALDHGTVYEALREGEPAGFFTIAAARQHKGDWYGVGKWESRAQLEAAEKGRAAALREKTRTLTDDEGPPKLRKPGSTDGASAGEKPTIAKPEPSPEPAPSPSKPPSPRIEAERVRPLNEPAIAPHDTDPDRPTLRRGGDGYGKQTLEPPPQAVSGASDMPHYTLIGVSDPDGTGNTRDFAFPWKPEEERALKAKVIAMAEAELGKYLAGRAKSAANKTSPKKAVAKRPAQKLANIQVNAYDLNLDNNAELIVTGSAGDAYITLIARTDLSFVPQKVFAVTTDKEHLDAIPRMELVGAIDAEGKGKGELLFRVISDAGYRYALYSVNREEAWPIWKSSLYGSE
jgi:hypothetical protein